MSLLKYNGAVSPPVYLCFRTKKNANAHADADDSQERKPVTPSAQLKYHRQQHNPEYSEYAEIAQYSATINLSGW